MQPDGTIYIDTKLDNASTEASSAQLDKALREIANRLNDAMKGIDFGGAMEKDSKKAVKALEEIRAKAEKSLGELEADSDPAHLQQIAIATHKIAEQLGKAGDYGSELWTQAMLLENSAKEQMKAIRKSATAKEEEAEASAQELSIGKAVEQSLDRQSEKARKAKEDNEAYYYALQQRNDAYSRYEKARTDIQALKKSGQYDMDLMKRLMVQQEQARLEMAEQKKITDEIARKNLGILTASEQKAQKEQEILRLKQEEIAKEEELRKKEIEVANASRKAAEEAERQRLEALAKREAEKNGVFFYRNEAGQIPLSVDNNQKQMFDDLNNALKHGEILLRDYIVEYDALLNAWRTQGPAIKQARKELEEISNTRRHDTAEMTAEQEAIMREIEGYSEAGGAIQKTRRELAQLKELKSKMDKDKVTYSDEEYNKTTKAIAEAEEKLKKLTGQQKESNIQQTKFKDIAPGVASTFEKLSASIKKMASEDSTALTMFSGLLGVFGVILSVGKKVIDVLKKIAVFNAKVLAQLGKFAITGAKGIGKVLSLFKELGENILDISKRMMGFDGKFQGLLKKIKSFGNYMTRYLARRLLFKAIQDVIGQIGEALKKIALLDSEFNQIMSSLKSANTQLKNSVAAMVKPLMQSFAPAVEKLVSLLTQATTSIGKFFAVLTGQDYYMEAIPLTEDYSGALDMVADSADDATKSLDRYLSPLDELNRWSDGSDKTDKGAQKLADALADANKSFRKVALSGAISELAERLRELYLACDWKGLGKEIADFANNKFSKLYELVRWSNLEPKIGKALEHFVESVNSFLKNLNGNVIGRSIGAFTNSLIHAVNILLDLDWREVGRNLADAIDGIFSEIDPKTLGAMLGKRFMLIPNILYGWVKRMTQNGTWRKIGTFIGESVKSWWENINLMDISNTLRAFVHGIGETLNGILESDLDFGNVGKTIAEAFNNVLLGLGDKDFMDGAFGIIKGLMNAIVGFFKNVDFVGIAKTASAYLDRALAYLTSADFVDGASSFVGSFVAGVIEFLKNATTHTQEILSALTSFLGGVIENIEATTGEPLWQSISTMVGNIIDGVDEFLKSPEADALLERISNTLGQVLANLPWDSIIDAGWQIAKKFIGGMISGFMEGWTGDNSEVVNTWGIGIETLKDDSYTGGYEAGKQQVQGLFDGIGDGNSIQTLKNAAKLVKDTINGAYQDEQDMHSPSRIWEGFGTNMLAGLINGIALVTTLLKTTMKKIVDIVNAPLVGVVQNVISAFNALPSALVRPINMVMQILQSMLNNISTAIKSAFSMIQALVSSLSAVKTIRVGNATPMRIPYLAQGAIIPPNAPFMAMLGDQRSGNNIEAPESLIRKIVREESGGGNGSYTFIAQLDGQTIFEKVISKGEMEQRRTGRNPFEYA